jgi:hypothetical protein
VDHGEVAAQRRVLGELLLEISLRRDRAGEDDQAGGVFVEALDRAEAGVVRQAAARFQPADGHPRPRQEGVAVRPLERHRHQAGRFADDYYLGIEMNQEIGLAARLGAAGADRDFLIFEQPRGGIGNGAAVDADLPAADEIAGLAPGETGIQLTQQGRDRLPRLVRAHPQAFRFTLAHRSSR